MSDFDDAMGGVAGAAIGLGGDWASTKIAASQAATMQQMIKADPAAAAQIMQQRDRRNYIMSMVGVGVVVVFVVGALAIFAFSSKQRKLKREAEEKKRNATRPLVVKYDHELQPKLLVLGLTLDDVILNAKLDGMTPHAWCDAKIAAKGSSFLPPGKSCGCQRK